MRWLLLLFVVLPAVAFARPKVAVAPLDGDASNKIGSIVADVAGDSAKVTGPDQVSHTMESLNESSLTPKALKTLRSRLEVDVVIHGKVEKDGGKKHLVLTLSGRGKKKSTLDVAIASPKALKKTLSQVLADKIAAATGSATDDDSDDDDAPKHKPADDDAPKHKPSADDDAPKRKPSDDDDAPHKKRVASDDSEHVRKSRDDDEDEGEHGKRKKRHRHHGDDDQPRNPMTQATVWFDAGAGVGRRTLTYDAGMTPTGAAPSPPPRVGTAGGAGELEGEVYPGAYSTPRSAIAGFGIYGAYSKSLGVGIKVPGTTVTSSIKEGSYAIGARYRFMFGASSLAVGASYWRRYYIADRSGLMTPDQLDMPDVDYTAIAPGAIVRFPATPTIAAFGSLDVPLMLSGGKSLSANGYGRATIYAVDVRGGAQITLAPHIALQLALAFDQIGISFASDATVTTSRGVTSATDRTIDFTAVVGVLY